MLLTYKLCIFDKIIHTNLIIMEKLKYIVAQFGIPSDNAIIAPLGNGLINDTFKVTIDGDKDEYVLQRINHHVFTNVDLLQKNIEAVTSHLRTKLMAGDNSDIDRKCLRFLTNPKTGKSYTEVNGEYWRMMIYLKHSVTRENLTVESAYTVGLAFGEFENNLLEITSELQESIPDFHNMEFRLEQFNDALEADSAGRAKNVADLIEQVKENAEEMTKLERLYREKRIEKRPCHCDTKLNNILFDNDGNILCVIDLDTVMPSFVSSDFGDFLRSAANTGKEDSTDLSEVNFNMDIFRSFAKGYIKSASFLTPLEKSLLPFAARLFPYMQAVRFLTDYLNGDVYYKIQYPEHNLVRTRAQMKLFDSASEKEREMTNFINSL